MFFVYTPTYDYDSLAELKEIETLAEVVAFIEEDLKKNEWNIFPHKAEDYTVIEGRKLEVATVEYASKVKIERSL